MHCQTSLSDTSSPPKKRTIKGYGSSASISNGNNKSVLFFAHEDFNIVWLSNPLTLSVMKVILETCHVHLIIRYLLFYFNIKYVETSEMM